MSELKETSSNKCFGGLQKVFNHESKELNCSMNFGIYLPSQSESRKVPVVYWLSGLAYTEQDFIALGGSQRYAEEHGLIIVCPDTSPRGCNIEDEDEIFGIGTGASFYVNATQEKWKHNYRMYSYITEELPALIVANFPAQPDKQSICGHSMGGHGALICALKNPGMYCSVSAFAPVCNPVSAPCGVKAFTAYLGNDRDSWKEYDACNLVKQYNGPPLNILIDQGEEDNFLPAGQLLPDNFVASCAESKIPVVLRMQEGYDHTHLFIVTFIEDHIKHHATYLNA